MKIISQIVTTPVAYQKNNTPYPQVLYVVPSKVVPLTQRQGNFFDKTFETVAKFVTGGIADIVSGAGNIAEATSEIIFKPKNLMLELNCRKEAESFTTEEIRKRAVIQNSIRQAPGVSSYVHHTYTHKQAEITEYDIEQSAIKAQSDAFAGRSGEEEAKIVYGQNQPLANGNPILNNAEKQYYSFMLKVQHGEADNKDLEKLQELLQQAEQKSPHLIKGEVDYLTALQATLDIGKTNNPKLRASLAKNFIDNHMLNEPLEAKTLNAQITTKLLEKYRNTGSHVGIRIDQIGRRLNAIHGVEFIPINAPENKVYMNKGHHSPGKYGYVFEGDYAQFNNSISKFRKSKTHDLNMYWNMIPSIFIKQLSPKQIEHVQDNWYKLNSSYVNKEMLHFYNRNPNQLKRDADMLSRHETARKSFMFAPHSTFRENRSATQDVIKKINSSFSHALEGSAKERLQDYKGAIDDYTKAIELNPKNGSFYHSRSDSKFLSRDTAGAVEDFTQCVKLEAEHEDNIMENMWLRHKALIDEDSAKFDKQKKDYEDALAKQDKNENYGATFAIWQDYYDRKIEQEQQDYARKQTRRNDFRAAKDEYYAGLHELRKNKLAYLKECLANETNKPT